jgi:hypothetical protein
MDLILGVCILLHVWDQDGEGGFPATQRYYRRFLLFIIYLTATCFGRTTIFRQIYLLEITLLTTDPLFLGY